ncbi:hypothetical protein CJF32_00003384 [Rutstroemia sp. NJR-2017a WRK4]|nr:hypothetical protein CJF32_00003384 [Rutstroemia sp. NJR-2017a WRK4]
MLEERRRRDRILHILTGRLRDTWTKGLPDEICWMIAGHLVRECAVITAQELPNEEPSDSAIDFSHDVYARHIVIEGIRYIRCLRNSAQSTPEVGETLLLKGQSSGDFRNVYIGEDHLGIRHIQLFSSSKPSVRTPGLWWRQLSEPCCDSTFRTKTDVSQESFSYFFLQGLISSQGLKLRDLLPSQEQSEIAPAHTYWAIPAPPVSIFDIVSLQAPLNQPNGLRMSFFDCNAAHTTGYSVAVDGVSIATIRAHGQDMDLTFYEEFKVFTDRPMVWIYMPIDEGASDSGMA